MKNTKRIVKLIRTLSSTEMEDFLVGILSPGELEQVIKRLEIVRLLKENVPQHEIASKLGVGVGTVSRGANMLKQGRFKYIK